MMKSRPTSVALWFIFTVVLAVAALGAQQSTSSDDDKGKALVESKCTLCHGLDEVRVANLDKAGWKELVESMRTKGADLKDDEATLVTDYLAKTYPVDTEAETFRKLKPVTRRVSNGVLNESLFHGPVIESGWTLRPGDDASARQRIFDSRDANGS